MGCPWDVLHHDPSVDSKIYQGSHQIAATVQRFHHPPQAFLEPLACEAAAPLHVVRPVTWERARSMMLWGRPRGGETVEKAKGLGDVLFQRLQYVSPKMGIALGYHFFF